MYTLKQQCNVDGFSQAATHYAEIVNLRSAVVHLEWSLAEKTQFVFHGLPCLIFAQKRKEASSKRLFQIMGVFSGHTLVFLLYA